MAATAQDNRPPRRLFKKGSALRRPARWNRTSSTLATRKDGLILSRWERAANAAAAAAATTSEPTQPYDRFAKYNVAIDAPVYDDEIYEKELRNDDWTREETDYLVEMYRECNGKWPVVADHYEHTKVRTMEDLKARFYSISAALLQLATPITAMTAADYARYEILSTFDASQETSRKKLAEGHLHRKANEVDEEAVLLGELQRIMLNQATLDSEREELRRRLDYPNATSNGYQYSTSAQLTSLWQTLFRADQMKKAPNRLRPTGNPTYDGPATMTPTSARPRESNAGLPDNASATATAAAAAAGRRGPNRDSLPAVATPTSAVPTDLSKAEQARYGVVLQPDRSTSGVAFASDKLSKPRIAKSTVQTEKIAAILAHIGVPELIALPTPNVIEQFEQIMTKVHILLEMRKVAEKEEQELKVRQAEAAAA